MHAGKCSTPMALVTNNVRIIGYEDPALEGAVITFTCPSGSTLIGPNSSTCMGSGEWEPDPREVNCIGVLITTDTPTIYRMPQIFFVYYRYRSHCLYT